MLTYIFVGAFVLFIGIAVGILMEQTISRRENMMKVYTDDFCWNNCKIHESVYSEFKDPDDAWKELDGGNHCEGCPMISAMDVLDDIQIEKWKKKKAKQERKAQK